jgi:lipopolysaccharide export system protein LptA
MWRLSSSLVLAVSLTASLSPAEINPAKPSATSSESNTTKISAKTMTVRNQESKAIFQGAVVMSRGSLIVHSDEMIVFFKSSGQGNQSDGSGDKGNSKNGERQSSDKSKRAGDMPTMSNRSVSMIEATGSVVIEKDDGRATCRKAIYYESEEKIVLLGDPVAWQKGTRVSGEKMTMYLADDRSVVEGGTQVVIEEAGQGSR